MKTISSFQEFAELLRDFIRANSNSEREEPFNQLALSLFALQFSSIAPYRKFCEARKVSPQKVGHWSEIPALPTSTFKELDISSLPTDERTYVFHSSGTTEQIPSRHFHNSESLAIYEASLLPWFQQNFLGDWDKLQENEVVGRIDKPAMIFLTPSPAFAPNSSLVHMFETMRRELGSRDSLFTGKLDEQKAWTLDIEQTLFALRKSMCANRPVAILGTAFSFVHLLDHFAENNIRYRPAEGSRALETGGYKNRSRTLPKAELHSLITKHLGIPASHIVCEYGMSELSSQAYASNISATGSEGLNADSKIQNSKLKIQNFTFPPWARVQIISPETGKAVCEGETGLIHIFDLANVYSAMAIQTEDLGVRRGDGFELIGRASLSEPRGCSLMTN